MKIKQLSVSSVKEDYKAHYEAIVDQLERLPKEVESETKRRIVTAIKPLLNSIYHDIETLDDSSVEAQRLKVNLANLKRALIKQGIS